MCIAIAKMAGVNLPNDTYLKNCWDNNNDGAGFAFNHEGKVVIKKGFMTFDSFMEALKAHDKRYGFRERGVLLHFRITTHGANNASMTHPFPIIDDAGCLKKIEYVSDYAVIHNGIISLTTNAANKSDGLSDTAVFIKDYLTKIASNKAWIRKQANIELIEKLIDSKMAFLDKHGNIKTTSGFHEHDGVLYSNTSYKDSYFRNYGNGYSSVYYKGGKKTYIPYNSHDDYSDYDNYRDSYEARRFDEYSDYDDYIADLVDNKNDIPAKYKNGLRGLMRLPAGYYVDCGDFGDYVNADDDYEYYVDSSFSLYMSYLDGQERKNSVEDENRDYIYMGRCTVYDHAIRNVSFKRDVWAYEDQFDS